MMLLEALTRRIGRRQEEQQKQLDGLRQQLTETQSKIAEFDTRIGTLETTVDAYVETFESELKALGKKGLAAKQQTARKLRRLHRELDLFVRILETSADRQMDTARKRKIDELLRQARAKRTRISNAVAAQRAVANDG
jgi:predicted  nucleic acid-binding Zn-ribbon protein